jgi:hypothetical protein
MRRMICDEKRSGGNRRDAIPALLLLTLENWQIKAESEASSGRSAMGGG